MWWGGCRCCPACCRRSSICRSSRSRCCAPKPHPLPLNLLARAGGARHECPGFYQPVRRTVTTFKAIVIEKADGGTKAALTDFDEANLMEGDVTVAVEYSCVNYKDGLAVTGKAPVVRRFPMIAGIDFAGTVEASSHPAWNPGDKVILNGWGCGESHLGAYGAKARVKGDWLVRLPASMSAREAMAIGTAGYTAMLAVMALERHGLTPAQGPVAVTRP